MQFHDLAHKDVQYEGHLAFAAAGGEQLWAFHLLLLIQVSCNLLACKVALTALMSIFDIVRASCSSQFLVVTGGLALEFLLGGQGAKPY